MPVPELETIQEIGRKILKTKDLSEANCDRILEEYIIQFIGANYGVAYAENSRKTFGNFVFIHVAVTLLTKF